MDSSRITNEGCRANAIMFLQQLHPGEDLQLPEPSNELFQTDSWSCGLWCLRWVAQSLRRALHTSCQHPVYMTTIETLNRANASVCQVRYDATYEPLSTKNEPKSQNYDRIEPQCMDKAIEYAWNCTRCRVERGKNGAQDLKGCEVCMGLVPQGRQAELPPQLWLER